MYHYNTQKHSDEQKQKQTVSYRSIWTEERSRRLYLNCTEADWVVRCFVDAKGGSICVFIHFDFFHGKTKQTNNKQTNIQTEKNQKPTFLLIQTQRN